MQRLLFDYSLNQYEISGSGLNQESLAYFESIITLLKRYAIVFPSLQLEDKEIRASQGARTYRLGEIHSQMHEGRRVIYPCFRDQWDFDFTKEISSFRLWKDMNESLRGAYSQLESDLLTARGEGARALIHLTLLKDFIAMAKLQGEDFIEKKIELNFLKGLVALYYLAIVQKKLRVFHGVNVSATLTRSAGRVKRAVKGSLYLLIGEDIASAKLYREFSSFEDPISMHVISLYFSYKSKGGLKNPEDLLRFSLAIKAMIAADIDRGRWRLDATLFPIIADVLDPHGTVPGDPEAVRRYLDNLDGDFVRFRKARLDQAIGREQAAGVYSISHHYRVQSPAVGAFWDTKPPRFIDLLPIDYISPSHAQSGFDGTINILAHADVFGLGGVSNPERIANWLYDNFSGSFGKDPVNFRGIKFINFTACHFPKAMAEYVTVLFLARCLEEGRFKVVGGDGLERNWLPNITVICSPHVSLVYLGGRFWPIHSSFVESGDNMSPLPGVVLNVMNAMRAREFSSFISRAGALDLNEPYVQQFLKETHLFSIDGLNGSDFRGGVISQDEFDQAKNKKAADYKIYEQGVLEERNRRRVERDVLVQSLSPPFGPLTREQHIANTEHLAYEMVSIKPKGEGAFLRVNTFETMRLLHGYYAEIKNRYRSQAPGGRGDSEANSRIYKRALEDLKRENRIKFLIDPLDPNYHYKRHAILKWFREHLGVNYREFQDFSFYSPHESRMIGWEPENYAWTSYYNQQLADILFVTTAGDASES